MSYPTLLLLDISDAAAAALQRTLDPAKTLIRRTGSALMGLRVSFIVLQRPRAYHEDDRLKENFDRWVEESARCRLVSDPMTNLIIV